MHSSIAIRILAAAALPTVFWVTANAAPQSVQGTATYRERIALPPTAVFEATLEDVSRADAPAETIARASVTAPGNPPISFTIPYDPAKILGTHRYVVRARILVDGKVLFATDGAIPVITRGGPNSVSLTLRGVGGGQVAPAPRVGAKPLEGTYWKAIELSGKPTPAQNQAHLVFQPGGRVSGSDGCNRIAGSYQLRGEVVTFGQVAGTQMACINAGDIERGFRDALKSATRLTRVGDGMELLDAAGTRLAAFVAGRMSGHM